MNLGYRFSGRIEDEFESLVQNIVYEKLEIAPARPGGQAELISALRCPSPQRSHRNAGGLCYI